MLSERFEGPVEHSVDPALCVALGAALQGAILGGEVFDHVLVDVAAHSLGVRCLGVGLDREGPTFEPDRFWSIIPRNTQIPVTRSEVFYTLVDEQEGIVESVYQGEEPLCRDNTLIGEFPFDLEPAPANSPVVVELSYDLDGIVCVRVHQKGTENRKQVTLDTRRRGESGSSEEREPLTVDNYVLRKARRLAGELDEELGRRMLAAAEAYETALSSELAGEALDPSELDRLEDELLERLEEAEEALQAVGA
jgi:molecular chaperone DnaK